MLFVGKIKSHVNVFLNI